MNIQLIIDPNTIQVFDEDGEERFIATFQKDHIPPRMFIEHPTTNYTYDGVLVFYHQGMHWRCTKFSVGFQMSSRSFALEGVYIYLDTYFSVRE